MSEVQRYLCFGLGNEEFAIPLLSVKEVLGIPETTPIPQAPAYFLGIMNLRGNVISVLDLRSKLGIKAQSNDENTVIILDLGDYNLGVIVDRVNSVIAVDSNEVSPKPTVDGSKANDYVQGVLRKDKRLVLLLDIAKALSVEDRSTVAKKASAKAA